jgi:hypothetical protein
MEGERSSGQDIVLFFYNNAATAKVIQNEITAIQLEGTAVEDYFSRHNK